MLASFEQVLMDKALSALAFDLYRILKIRCERFKLLKKTNVPMQVIMFNGASVAQWSERSPFTSEVAGSILSENFLNVTRDQCSTNAKRVTQHSAESRGFSPGAPVSSHREVDRVG